MSARARVLVIVAVVACAAVGGTVGATLLESRGQGTVAAGSVTKPQKGHPFLFLDFGVRADPEARALTTAARLLNAGKTADAAATFARYHSLQAQIGLAFARWPKDGGLDELKRLVNLNPDSPTALFHLGMAYYWSGRIGDAAQAWQRVASHFPDSPESVEAENLLYTKDKPGLPLILTTVGVPSAPSIGAQLRIVSRAARRPGATATDKLRYGLVLWQLWRRVSAERQFEAAAKLAPKDPVVQTAAAVGLFTKRAPVRAFARLGPLTATFPHAAVVPFHLALLLIQTRQPVKALKELRVAIADEPTSIYGKEAQSILVALRQHGTR